MMLMFDCFVALHICYYSQRFLFIKIVLAKLWALEIQHCIKSYQKILHVMTKQFEAMLFSAQLGAQGTGHPFCLIHVNTILCPRDDNCVLPRSVCLLVCLSYILVASLYNRLPLQLMMDKDETLRTCCRHIEDMLKDFLRSKIIFDKIIPFQT